MSAYTTIDAAVGGDVDSELEIKRSRFLTRLRRVTTEEQAREVIHQQRKAHFGAAHHCTAFVLGRSAEIARSSDDGEPSGTAGIPILGVLQQSELTEVVAIVTRYFGGIKLGAGGLVRAYSAAASQAVAAAGRRTVERRLIVHVDVALADAGHVEQSIRSLTLPCGSTVVVTGTTWDQQARLSLAVPGDSLLELQAALASLSGGQLQAQPSHHVWADVI